MNKTLTSILQTQGPKSLEIFNQNFSNEYILEEFLDCYLFDQSVDFTSTFFFECELININLSKVKLDGTSVVKLNTRNIIFNDLQFNEFEPMKIFKSKENFSLNEASKVANSLDFQTEIEIH